MPIVAGLHVSTFASFARLNGQVPVVGVVAGLGVGLGICWAQVRFGLVPLVGSVVEYYPVKVLGSDLLLVFGTVTAIGLLATWIPLRALSRRFLQATSAME